MKFSLLNTLYTRKIITLTKYREADKVAILQALGQVVPYRFVIKLYTAWILSTANLTGFRKTLRMGFFLKIEFDVGLISSTIELTRVQVLGRSYGTPFVTKINWFRTPGYKNFLITYVGVHKNFSHPRVRSLTSGYLNF